jgi:hypothetical protein
VTIYVPTEGGMPVPTLQMNKWHSRNWHKGGSQDPLNPL